MINIINELNQHIANQFRSRRKKLKLSQREVGQKIGVTPQQVQKYEQAVNKISAAKLFIFSQILKTDLYYFFSNEKITSLGFNPTTPRQNIQTQDLIVAFENISDQNLRYHILSLVEELARK